MIEYPLNPGTWEVLPMVVLVFYVFCTLVQLGYYWIYFRRLAFYRSDDDSLVEHAVSVVICARNEYYNLKENLPLFLTQDYPHYEVIVVNDSSDDQTKDLLDDFKNKYGNLRVFNLEKNLNFFQGKKFPLALGIKSASYEVILLTDADCKPAGTQWIRKMQSGYTTHTDIVLGYGGYIKTKSFINLMIRYETLHAAMQYLSFALAGKPYMGVGRNLSYRKSLFIEKKGFSSHYTVHSGDDDLFINSVANSKNTRIEISKESHTLSPSKKTLGQWIIQKRRHLVTSPHYKKSSKRILGFYSATKFGFYLSLTALLILNYNFIIFGPAAGLYFLSLLLLVFFVGRKLNEGNLVLFAPLFDILLTIVLPLIYLSNLAKKPERWK